MIASDKKNNSIFYGASGATFYLSVDGGKTFAAKGSLGSSTTANKVVVNVNVTGDIWVSTDKGIFHTTNSGTSFSAVTGPTQAWAIALGAPKTSGGYPALYAVANIGSVGYFRRVGAQARSLIIVYSSCAALTDQMMLESIGSRSTTLPMDLALLVPTL